MASDNGFIIIDNVFLQEHGKRLGHKGIAVLSALLVFADKDGYCWPSQTTICEYAGMSRPTLIDTVEKMVKDGYLALERRFEGGIQSHIYQLLIPAHTPKEEPKTAFTPRPLTVVKGFDSPRETDVKPLYNEPPTVVKNAPLPLSKNGETVVKGFDTNKTQELDPREQEVRDARVSTDSDGGASRTDQEPTEEPRTPINRSFWREALRMVRFDQTGVTVENRPFIEQAVRNFQRLEMTMAEVLEFERWVNEESWLAGDRIFPKNLLHLSEKYEKVLIPKRAEEARQANKARLLEEQRVREERQAVKDAEEHKRAVIDVQARIAEKRRADEAAAHAVRLKVYEERRTTLILAKATPEVLNRLTLDTSDADYTQMSRESLKAALMRQIQRTPEIPSGNSPTLGTIA